MLKRKKDRAAVEEFCTEVRNKLGKTVKTMKLFGSKVIDKDISGSDIDIFIVVSERTSEVEDIILDIAFELDLKYNVYISPRIVSQGIINDPVWRNTPLIKSIEHQGIPL